ncbi:MAG: DSD1 family PLP-dependent enzyme [Pseudomonadota bacterium]
MFYLLLAVLALVVALIAFRPGDRGRPHERYFDALQQTLKDADIDRPRLVIDRQRLDANIDALVDKIGRQRYRIVAKSLPSLPLLRHIMERSGSDKLMVFHRPFLSILSREFPRADILLGKPLSAVSLGHFLAGIDQEQRQSACDKIQWLVDTADRLRQYDHVASEHGLTLRINLEIDVGLHRGGFTAPETMRETLTLLRESPRLTLSGLMGYEPHIAKMPMATETRMERARHRTMDHYQAFKNMIKKDFSDLYSDDLTFNGAGSPTCQLYRNDDTLNDISAGSSLLMPGDFDLASVRDQQQALFIATPVLKKLEGTNLPFLERLTPLLSRYNPNWQHSFFIYGGYWKAAPRSPEGLSNNGVYGRSSNQEMLNGSGNTRLEVDDFVFLRPSQSEAVLLEFGDILAVADGKIEARWPHLAQVSARD